MFGTHPDDVGYTEHVAQCVQAVCAENNPTQLYAPLGVGSHIDHRLTYAAVRMQGAFSSPTYYEDRPYALVRYAVRMRLTELGLPLDSGGHAEDLQAMPEDLLKESFLDSFDSAHWTQTYLPPGPERETCKSQFVARLLHNIPETNNTYRSEVQTYDRNIILRVIDAVMAYSSQFPDLFASRRPNGRVRRGRNSPDALHHPLVWSIWLLPQKEESRLRVIPHPERCTFGPPFTAVDHRK